MGKMSARHLAGRRSRDRAGEADGGRRHGCDDESSGCRSAGVHDHPKFALGAPDPSKRSADRLFGGGAGGRTRR